MSSSIVMSDEHRRNFFNPQGAKKQKLGSATKDDLTPEKQTPNNILARIVEKYFTKEEQKQLQKCEHFG